MPVSRKYLDPETIAGLRGLELRARAIVSGTLSGMHRSAYHGYSVEFAEHRAYAPGDDIRHVDWRIFGRQDRFFIKQYEEETHLRCHILLDASHSMAFTGRREGSRPASLSKFDYGASLAASLAYLLIHQQDATGLMTFDHAVRQKLAPGTGKAHLRNLITVLEGTEPSGQTDVKILFHQLAEELSRRSVVVLISDLLTDSEAVVSGLEHICYRGHELILLHVMDDAEWNFPFVENVLFEGLEDDLRLLVDPQSLRHSYLQAVQRFVGHVRAVCLKHHADYVPVNTRDPLNVVLSGYLSRRAGSASARRATAGAGSGLAGGGWAP